MSKPFLFALLAGSTLLPIWLFRTGFLESIITLTFFPFQDEPISLQGAIEMTSVAIAASLISGLPFVAYYWPCRKKEMVPKISLYILVALCILFVLRIFFFEELRYDPNLDRVSLVNDTNPGYPVLRRADGIILLIVIDWTLRYKREVGSDNQLVYHWALFGCLVWAAAVPLDWAFGTAVLYF